MSSALFLAGDTEKRITPAYGPFAPKKYTGRQMIPVASRNCFKSSQHMPYYCDSIKIESTPSRLMLVLQVTCSSLSCTDPRREGIVESMTSINLFHRYLHHLLLEKSRWKFTCISHLVLFPFSKFATHQEHDSLYHCKSTYVQTMSPSVARCR